MAVHERPTFNVTDTELAFFKNKLIHDISELLSSYGLTDAITYNGDIVSYDAVGKPITGNISTVQENIGIAYSFIISSQIINILPDSNCRKLIEYYNTNKEYYEILSKSLKKYIIKSCAIYCSAISFSLKYQNELSNMIDKILSEIYN